MRYADGSNYDEPSYLSLLGLLIGGIVAVFYATPVPFVTRLRIIVLPLIILLGLIAILLWNWRHEHDDWDSDRIARHGWIGVFVSGIIGIWLLTLTVTRGAPLISIYGEVLTVISLGMGGGVVIGGYTQGTLDRPRAQVPQQSHILTESTWTHQPGPEPILLEIVEQVAELEGIDPCDLAPLSTYIDPAVFSRIQDDSHHPWQVRFHTDKYEILVNSHGTLTIYGSGWADTPSIGATNAGSTP